MARTRPALPAGQTWHEPKACRGHLDNADLAELAYAAGAVGAALLRDLLIAYRIERVLGRATFALRAVRGRVRAVYALRAVLGGNRG